MRSTVREAQAERRDKGSHELHFVFGPRLSHGLLHLASFWDITVNYADLPCRQNVKCTQVLYFKLFLKIEKHPNFPSHSSLDTNCQGSLGKMIPLQAIWYFLTEQSFPALSTDPFNSSLGSVIGILIPCPGKWLQRISRSMAQMIRKLSILTQHGIYSEYHRQIFSEHQLCAKHHARIWNAAMNITRSFSWNLSFWLEQITCDFLQRHCGWFNKLLKISSGNKWPTVE